MGMVDVGMKPKVERVARARGEIVLREETIKVIREGSVKKGDPLFAAELAGILAAKQTHVLIPHCHQIPLDTVEIHFELLKDKVIAHCTVKAHWNTGVEMEAIVGVSIALNTIWDMVKYLEKDQEGQYPGTRIEGIQVVEKTKAAA